METAYVRKYDSNLMQQQKIGVQNECTISNCCPSMLYYIITATFLRFAQTSEIFSNEMKTLRKFAKLSQLSEVSLPHVHLVQNIRQFGKIAEQSFPFSVRLSVCLYYQYQYQLKLSCQFLEQIMTGAKQ